MRNVKKFVVCGDSHGAECEQRVVKTFHEFVRWYKPDVRIHLGDVFDFGRLRRGAGDDEKRAPLRDDLDAGLQFLTTFKPTHFLRGNHDERMWDALKSDDGALSDLATWATTDIEEAIGGAQMLPYCKRRGVLKLGHLKVVHGYHSGVTAARLAAQVYGSVLMGHVHAIDQYSIPGLERRIGRCIGCLCKLDQDYNRAQANTLRQSHGWGYGLLLDGGDYVYWQAEQVAGKWYFPSEVKAF